MAIISGTPVDLSLNAKVLHKTTTVRTFIATRTVVSATEKAVRVTVDEQLPAPTPAPDVKPLHRCIDLARLAITRFRVDFGGTLRHPTPRKSRPISEKGLFAYRYVDPLFSWWGHNSRVLASPSLGAVDVQNESGTTSTLINGASHNYGAWYRQTPESARLHCLCLDMLPIMSSLCHDKNTSSLRLAMHSAIADFFDADFCYSTSTGYGSNYFALPALLQGSRVAVIADSYSHNSIFTGCFLSPSAKLFKFKHNDMKRLESLLREEMWAFDRVVVIVEGLMEGDVPPLVELARLKQRYGFILYCDEAHSFLTLGKTGRGCLELWNERHPEAPLPSSLIDIRSGTLSKSVGGIGGFVVGKAEFEPPIRDRFLQDEIQESMTLPTSTVVQTLWILNQPAQTCINLCYLADIAKFVRKELQRVGIYVYGEPDTPIIPVWAGGPSTAARLSYEMRREGLLASPVSTPAVPFWESRVRINLSADYTPDQVNRLVAVVIKAIAICGIQKVETHGHGLPRPEEFRKIRHEDRSGESSSALVKIQHLMHEASHLRIREQDDGCSLEACQVAHRSQYVFGIGSGSARWISGTYLSHLDVEDLVTRATGTQTTMTYPDGAIGLASTIAALIRPVLGTHRHYLLVPTKTNSFVSDGFLLGMPTKSKKQNTICRYHTVEEIPDSLRLWECKAGKKVNCYTVYLCVHDSQHSVTTCPSQCPGTQAKSLPSILTSICKALKKSVLTIVIRLSTDLVNLRSPIFDFVNSQENIQLLLYGSFTELYGLQGGFLAGPQRLIQELRYSSRGYMYTTSTPPFVMDMIKCRLQSEDIVQGDS